MDHQILHHPLQYHKNLLFLRQFCTVLSVTISHDKTSIFITSNTEMFGSDLLPSIASIIFWTTLFCTSLLRSGWPLDPLTVRLRLCLEEERKSRLLLILQFQDGLYKYRWWAQLSGVIFLTDYQALWPILRKALNLSSFCSGFGNGKVIFWYFWNI